MYLDLATLAQVVVALATLANTLLLIWQGRKVASVHTLVNGTLADAVRNGMFSRMRRGNGTTLPPPAAPPPAQ